MVVPDFGAFSPAPPEVGTAITEGTANFLVNRRMNKGQQMRWSRRGADLLLQVRCAVYNGTFGSEYGQQFHPANELTPTNRNCRLTPSFAPVPSGRGALLRRTRSDRQ